MEFDIIAIKYESVFYHTVMHVFSTFSSSILILSLSYSLFDAINSTLPVNIGVSNVG